MAPRREDIDVDMSDSVAFCSSSSFSTDRFTKSSLSFLSAEEEESPRRGSTGSDVDNAKFGLRESLQLIMDRGERLLHEVCNALDNSNEESKIIVDVCNSSLQSEFLSMVDEAQLLLENMGAGGDHPLTMITSSRVSLALVRVDAYLEAIETSLKCLDRDRLDKELFAAANSISTQLKSSLEEEKFHEDTHVPLQISPWNMGSLAFDLTVGSPAQFALAPKPNGLPMNVDVRAILEIQAKDIYDGRSLSYRACKVHVERCVHEVNAYHAGAGTVGEALVQIRVSPILEADGAKPKSGRSWSMDKKEVMPLYVKEART